MQIRLSISGVDIEFEAGSGITALFGPGGAGKTAILDGVAGFARPVSGRIILDDEILFDAASGVNLPPRKRHCGYVAREWALFPKMSVRENLLFPLNRLPRLERHRRVKEMLERFALFEAASRLPDEISAAERLRCAFARALIGEPKLLLADEPAGGLDAGLCVEWHRALRMVRDETEVPVLLATRKLETCFEVAGSMVVLDAGRVLQTGAPRKVFDQPSGVDAARVLGIPNIFSAEILALDPGRNTSRLRLENFELAGPYFPGHLRGDRVWLCAHTGELRAGPNDGSKPQPNRVPVRLERALEMPRYVRVEFAGPIVVEMTRQEFERQKDNKEWLVEFPPQALRVL